MSDSQPLSDVAIRQIGELNAAYHLRLHKKRCHPLIYIALSITSFGTMIACVLVWRMI